MPRDPRFNILFEPLKIGPVTTKNRFYQVPHCTGSGWHKPRTLAGLREVKAEGGWGVVNTEYCSIHPSSDDAPHPSASLWDKGDIKSHALMTEKAIQAFGARHINDAETIITGYNVFYDRELQSKHERVGAGLELLSSIFEFRANAYQAVSKTITYNGIQETALDGYDAKFTANLPYFYSSNLYGKLSNWKDSASYETEHYEAGINAEIAPNLTLRVAAQHKKDSGKTEGVASLNYSVPLGGANQPAKVKQDGDWSTKFEPIREKLYRPVQRENRIMKKAIKLGVTVSGY